MKRSKDPWVVTPLPVLVGIISTYFLTPIVIGIVSVIIDPNGFVAFPALLIGGLYLLLPFGIAGALVTGGTGWMLRYYKSHVLHAVAMGLGVFAVATLLLSISSPEQWASAAAFAGTLGVSTMISRLLVSPLIKSQSERPTPEERYYGKHATQRSDTTQGPGFEQ